MNKAFLTLDTDHDGWVEPKDIVAAYGVHLNINFNDLVKLMDSVSAHQDGTGRLNYADFSKWMGNEIHNLASFIFRHDSKKNPVQEEFMRTQERLKGKDKRAAAIALMADGNILDRLINKIRQQWGTVNKAFKDFNEDNDEYI